MKKSSLFIITVFALFMTFFANDIIIASERMESYDGELGYSYSSSSTEFRVWSSSANEIEIVVQGVVNDTRQMTKDENTGVWIGFVPGDLSGCEYSI